MEKRGLTARLREAGCRSGHGVYWGDEMRLGLIGQVRRVWAPRGVKVVQDVQFRREWRYLNLAVNGLEGKLVWGWTENMKAESIAPVIQNWHTQGVTVMVWDRARGHRGAAYDAVAVTRIEQPAYSPELNPAERILEHLRAKVEGKVYATLADKCATIEAELKTLAADPEKVKRLAGWDWIRESIAALSG